MNLIRRFPVVATVLVLSSRAIAQDAGVMNVRLRLDSTIFADHSAPQRLVTIDEILERADAVNPQLLMQRAQTDVARAQSYQSSLDLFPESSLGVLQKTVDGTAQGTGGDLVDVDYRSYQNSVWFGYRLNVASQIFSALSARDLLLEQRMNLVTIRQQALAIAVHRYDNLMVAAVGLSAANRSLRDHLQVLDITEERKALGLSSDLDVAKARSRVGSLRRSAAEAHQLYTTSSTSLAVWVDIPPEELVLPGSPEMYPIVNWADTSDSEFELSNHPRVVAARHAKNAAGQGRNAAIADLLLPEVDARIISTDLGIVRDSLTSRHDAIVLLNWTVSAGDLAKIRGTQAKARREKLAWKLTQQEMVGAYVSARFGFLDSEERLTGAKDAHDAAIAAQAAALAAYENGLISIIDVFDAEDQLAQASLDLALAIADADSRWIDLRLAQGNLTKEAIIEKVAENH